MTSPSAYETVADLTEAELELVTAGDFGRVLAVQAERAAIVAGLPGEPPAEARAALERAAGTQAQVTALLALRIAGPTGR